MIGIVALCSACNAQTIIYQKDVIQARQFAGRQDIDGIDCPNVTQIGGDAFAGSSIQKVFLSSPQPVTLQLRAFAGAQHLKIINLGETQTIPDSCFDGCTRLRLFEAKSVTNIGNYAFNNCQWLKTVFLPCLDTIAPNAFTNSEILPLAKYKIPVQIARELPWRNQGINLMSKKMDQDGGIWLSFSPGTFNAGNSEDKSFVDKSFEEDSK